MLSFGLWLGYESGGFTFIIATKVTKGLGPQPPKAEKPDDIPKIRKLATLRQYGFFYGIPPGFSPAERFFRQRPGGYGVPRDARRIHTGHLCWVLYLTTLVLLYLSRFINSINEKQNICPFASFLLLLGIIINKHYKIKHY